MGRLSDEDRLIHYYNELISSKKEKHKSVEALKEIELANGLEKGTARLHAKLSDVNAEMAYDEAKQMVLSAKSLIVQYAYLKGANPACVIPQLTLNVDKLIKVTAKAEARFLKALRLTQAGGMQINLDKVFSSKKAIDSLGGMTADAVVMKALDEARKAIKGQGNFICGSGVRYHAKDCPYCKGKKIEAVTERYLLLTDMTPCKCLTTSHATDSDAAKSDLVVSVFVDESLFPVEFDSGSKDERVANFSYIICAGRIEDESLIRKDITIRSGVDYIKENKRIELISESAMSKVLLILAFDLEFRGHVIIYTDSLAATRHFRGIAINSKLIKMFASVECIHISRNKNTRADQMLRNKVHLEIPTNLYKETIAKSKKADELELRVKQLETELALQKKAIEEAVSPQRKGSLKDVLKGIVEGIKVRFLSRQFNDNGITS